MKTKEQIKLKIEQVMSKRLKQRMDKYLSNNCKNCKYFCQKVVDFREIDYCKNASFLKKTGDNIIEETQKKCEYFSCKTTPEEIKSDFYKDLSDPSICGIKEPKLAVLIWVLREEQEEQHSIYRDVKSANSSCLLKLCEFTRKVLWGY
jgi:hypothetical protein